MSTFKVPVTQIRSLSVHPNADRLELAKIYDWQVVVPKGEFHAGDVVVYCPVDGVLDQDLENRLFPPDSKIKLNKHRVKSIKIRGQISQGMIINWEDAKIGDSDNYDLETDVAELVGILKYEPPEKSLPQHMQIKKKKKNGNPLFKVYTDIENFKYYDRTFVEGEQCYISEKLHGTSFRCGWYPMAANTLWKKLKKFFGRLPEWEFCYGSRKVEISARFNYKGYYGHDVYGKMVEQYKLKENIPLGRAIYGEIIGDGIQSGYVYGCGKDEHRLLVYDVMDTTTQTYLDYPAFKRETSNMNVTRVPELYVGPYSRAEIDKHRDGPSVVFGAKEIREGVVIKPIPERTTGSLKRVVLKYISEAYYLKAAADEASTDFH